MNYSAVLITPVAHRDAANNLGEELGWGPGNFSVALSADGTEPATHYGCRALATETLVSLLNGAAQGQWPEGITPVPDVVEALIVDLRPDADRHGHFEAVLGSSDLKRVITESEL